MQYFGIIETKYDEIFLTQSYMYFNEEDEIITSKDLKEKIKTAKDRKKNIIGTVFLYNPLVTPVGFDSNKYLLEQNFEDFGKMIELKGESYITIFKHAMRDQCKGKIVEIKNLFNLIEKNIDIPVLLEKFNNDLESYNSFQTTQFDRDIMYVDAANFIPNGKFVFFCWGDKIKEKEFPYINDYAKSIYENSMKLGKKVVYVYKKEKTQQGAVDYLQFSNPVQNHKYKNPIIASIKKAFEEFPPSPMFYE